MRVTLLFFIFFIFSYPCFAATDDNEVPTVSISADRTAENSFSQAPKTVITQQDITQSGATSLSQALQELGGVQLQDTTGNGSQVALSMRGFGVNAASNTLLLVNGIPITNPDLAPPDLNAIPISEIATIEIIGGSESVLYGDQAVGGIINIVTRKNSPERVSISCSGGSYDTRTCYATLNSSYKKLDYAFNFLTNHTDNYRVRNDYDQTHLAGNLNYNYATGVTAFDYQISNERMQYPGALTAEQVQQNRRQAQNDTDFFRDWNGTFHLANEQQLGSDWQFDTDIMRREMHGDGVLSSAFNQSREINFIKPELKGTIRNVSISTGMDFENDRYDLSSLFGVTNDTEQKYGIFSIAKIPVNSRLSISVGARGAQQNNQLKSFQFANMINRAIATTLGATYQLLPNTQLYLRRAESFRFPKADENASAPIGVDGLKTQRGVSYETGAKWFWKKFTTKLGLFQLNLRDEITFDPIQTPLQPFGVDRNLDPTVRRGFTLSEKYRVFDNFALDGQYNYVKARFQSGQYAGNQIPLVSENIFHGGADYRITEHWNLYTEAVYTGSQFAANDNANVTGKNGGYTVYNANVGYYFKEFSATFRLNNIFNKYYYFYSAYQPSIDEEFFYPAPGRNFLLTLKYSIA